VSDLSGPDHIDPEDPEHQLHCFLCWCDGIGFDSDQIDWVVRLCTAFYSCGLSIGLQAMGVRDPVEGFMRMKAAPHPDARLANAVLEGLLEIHASPESDEEDTGKYADEINGMWWRDQ